MLKAGAIEPLEEMDLPYGSQRKETQGYKDLCRSEETQ
jgi:hypothetical protein